MQKAHEFIIKILKDSGDTMEKSAEKAGISKSTVSRLMSGQPVNTDSLRRIAAAYEVLDQFLAVQSAASDPRRAAEDLQEMYRRSEQMVVDNCQERIQFMEERIVAMERSHEKEVAILTQSHEKEISALTQSHEKEIAALNLANDRIAQAYAETANGYQKRVHLYSTLFGAIVIVCILAILMLAYYIHYDLSHLDLDHSQASHLPYYVMGTSVRMSMFLS